MASTIKPQNKTEYVEQMGGMFTTIWTELHPGDDEEAKVIAEELLKNSGIRVTRKENT